MHDLVSLPLYNSEMPHNHPHSITVRVLMFTCLSTKNFKLCKFWRTSVAGMILYIVYFLLFKGKSY